MPAGASGAVAFAELVAAGIGPSTLHDVSALDQYLRCVLRLSNPLRPFREQLESYRF